MSGGGDPGDRLARDGFGLLSGLLQQAAVAAPIVYRAAEQCACRHNPGWTAHRAFLGDGPGAARLDEAEAWLAERFPPVCLEIGDDGASPGEAAGFRVLSAPPARLAPGVAWPVRVRIRNRGPAAITVRVVGCDRPSLDLWRTPVDPWNVRIPRSLPAVQVPADASGWLVVAVTPHPGHPVPASLPLRLRAEPDAAPPRDLFLDIPVTPLGARPVRIRTPHPARLRVETALGTLALPERLHNRLHVLPEGIHPFPHLEESFDSLGDETVWLPEGPFRVEARRGFEHRVATAAGIVDPADRSAENPPETADDPLEVFLACDPLPGSDLPAGGWYSGDTHVHWGRTWVYLGDDAADIARIQRAADCRAVAVLALSQWDGYQEVFTPVHHPMGPIDEHSDGTHVMGMDEEYRNSGPYGHVNLLGLSRMVTPVSTGDTRGGPGTPDFPDNAYAFRAAHAQGAIALCSHGIFAFDRVLAALGLLDAADQADPASWYPLLQCGFRIPVTVGTDANARPLGKMRTYVRLDGPLSYPAWVDGIRWGRTFVTSGPLLRLTVREEREGTGSPAEPGDVLRPATGSWLRVEAEALADPRMDPHHPGPLQFLEIVRNGQVAARVEPGAPSGGEPGDGSDKGPIDAPGDGSEPEQAAAPGDGVSRLCLSVRLPAGPSGWIAARTSAGAVCDWMDNAPSAHTSPVYIECDGQPMGPDPAAADRIAGELDAYLADLPRRAVFATPAQQEEVEERVRTAIRIYRRMAGGDAP